ncbi:MAG: phosphatase PAP2 family protein [Clostridia bacterium]|nr:phosphatase PAP2 family protein [Clostridia bacterium]
MRKTTEKLMAKLPLATGVLTAFFALIYLIFLFLALLGSAELLLRVLLFSAIPFLVVSLGRALIPSPRPKSAGATSRRAQHSFPSRHAFSAFFIAMMAFQFSTVAAYLLLPLSILLSVLRVLLGEHHPRDVIAGAFIGVLSGIFFLTLV